MNKSTTLRAILMVIFIPGIVALGLGWLADMQFTRAEMLERAHQWPEALARYEKAIAFDPYDARHLSAFGNALFSRGLSPDGDRSLLLRAASFYRRAIAFDPRNAGYRLMRARVKLRLGPKGAHDVREVMEDLQAAHALDPNGFNISYEIGYAGLPLWDQLDADER